MPLRAVQVTPDEKPVVPVTVAAHAEEAAAEMLAGEHATEIEEMAGVTVMLAEADLVGSCTEVAVTVAWPAA